MLLEPTGATRGLLAQRRPPVGLDWTAGGQKLLVNADYLMLIDLSRDGIHRTTLYEGARWGSTAAALSPDGRTLVLTRDACRHCPGNSANRTELFLVNHDGERRLTFNNRYDGDASWSPKGDRIAYATNDGIFVMDADGASSRRLTRDGYQQNPAWSPDGRQIAFDDGEDVFAVDVSTKHVRKLTSNPGPDRAAAWSPDGRALVYLARRACARCFSRETPLAIWIVRADGTSAHPITAPGYTPPTWGWHRGRTMAG